MSDEKKRIDVAAYSLWVAPPEQWPAKELGQVQQSDLVGLLAAVAKASDQGLIAIAERLKSFDAPVDERMLRDIVD